MHFIRLIKKPAQAIQGVDLSKVDVGDVILVAEAVAAMLIREGWAELTGDEGSAGKKYTAN